MIKKLRPVFFAVVVGCTCAFFLFREVEKKTLAPKSEGNAVAVQIGVFKDEENAQKMRDTYGGVVFKDEELFRVYYSILNKDDNINFITKYLNEKGINYYLKKLNLKDEVLDSSLKIEALMSKTNGESKLALNEELLNMYKEVI